MDITGKIIRDVLKPPPTEEELNFELDFWEDADGEDVCSLLWAADAASRSAFCQVPFAAWALTALDEEVPAMELLHWCPGIEEHLPEHTYHSQVYSEPAEFRTELSLLLGVMASSPQSLAQSITEADLELFRDAFVLEFMDPDQEHKCLKELGNAWNQ
ncbi:hypothetical protein CIRG_07645 [Coccidioides immitis RMSCC 2394]|uniref:Uncharacterized protein n=1 Tax=Coccidioides immitis RMSCC 2394 TaxID=404692 RepID=A0A0J6YLE5_COCIT|nr:hypothetical protein CIRG_07645 [Coccidioides immitis RMSCC 2394]